MKKVKVISISALGIILVMLLTTYLYMDSNNKDSMYYANAKEPLEFETAYNSSEVTHPSVINLNKKISGYKYWMANTPYVKSNALTENPHIFASNDLVNWEVPKGLVNPLDIPTISNSQKHYNSDTDLIYNEKKHCFELTWRYVNRDDGMITIFYSSSTNGIKWTPRKNIITTKFSDDALLSQSIVYENNIYKMWSVDMDGSVYYRETKDFKIWSPRKNIVMNYNDPHLKAWHLEVKKQDGKYEMLVDTYYAVGIPNKKDRKHLSLYHTNSNDALNWSEAKEIIRPTMNVDDFDGKRIYRSSFIKEGSYYYVYYGGFAFDKSTRVGLSYGKTLDDLKGMESKVEILKLK